MWHRNGENGSGWTTLSSPFLPMQTEFHNFKGSLIWDFRSQFFSWISVPQAPKYSTGAVLNFVENSRRYSRINVYHRCQRHRQKAVQRCQRHRRKKYRRCRWHWRLVLVTDFQWSPVSLIPGINLSLTPVTNYQRWQRHQQKIYRRWQEQGLHGGGELPRIGESWRG